MDATSASLAPPYSHADQARNPLNAGWPQASVELPTGPLAGIRVLDLTSVVLGPLATQILGDFGADVIKVEGTEGDPMRANGVSRHPGMGATFIAINRNKRSIALNLKTPEGRHIFLQMAAHADVVIHNMRVTAVERLGIGYEAVRAANPSVVYCAATGFGQNGPYRAKPAYDDIIQAASGMVDLVRQVTGQPEYIPTLIADKTAGMAVVNALLAALLHRQRSNQGQYVEVPMLETLVEFTMAEHLGGLSFRPAKGAAGYDRITRGGRRPSATADGHIAMLPYSPQQWRALFEQTHQLERLEPYNLSSRQHLGKCIRELYQELAAITPLKTTAEWMSLCEVLDIPATPIATLDTVPEHPHLQAVGMFQDVEHPSEGPIRMVRPATLFSETPASVRMVAPRLGQHTGSILASSDTLMRSFWRSVNQV